MDVSARSICHIILKNLEGEKFIVRTVLTKYMQIFTMMNRRLLNYFVP